MAEATAITRVKLSQLIPDPDNPRSSMDQGALKELAASIASEGLLEPIQVSTNGDDKFHVVDGHRRYQAIALNAGPKGDPEVEVIVRTYADDNTRAIAQLVHNLQREDLDVVDEGRAYARLMDLGMKVKEIGARVGRSQAHISKRAALAKLGPKAVEALRKQRVGLAEAYELSRFCPDYLDEVENLFANNAQVWPGVVESFARRINQSDAKAKAHRALEAKGIEPVEVDMIDMSKHNVVQKLKLTELDKIEAPEGSDRIVALQFPAFGDAVVYVLEPLPQSKLQRQAQAQDERKAADREERKQARNERDDRLARANVMAIKPKRTEITSFAVDELARTVAYDFQGAKLTCDILELPVVTRKEKRVDKEGNDIEVSVNDYSATVLRFSEKAFKANDRNALERLAAAFFLVRYVTSPATVHKSIVTWVESNTELNIAPPEGVDGETGEVIDIEKGRSRRTRR